MGGEDGGQSVCLVLIQTLDVDGNARRVFQTVIVF